MKQGFLELQKKFHKTPESKRYFWQTQNSVIAAREQKLLSVVRRHHASLALELGSGEGANAYNLRRSGWTTPVIGIDYSSQKAAFANDSKIADARFLTGDITRIPFRANTFDFVFCRDVFHHILDKPNALREISRVSRPGSTIVLIEGNVLKFTNHVFSWVNPTERGMKESTPGKFNALIRDSVPTLQIKEILMMEPSNLFRFLLHYSMGRPALAENTLFLKLLYWIEKAQTCMISTKKWAYMAFLLENKK